VLTRPPQEAELATLLRLFEQQQQRFSADRAAAQQLLAVGESPLGRDGDPVQMAALTVVAHALLNLDETITNR
jgi:hypothetical protein